MASFEEKNSSFMLPRCDLRNILFGVFKEDIILKKLPIHNLKIHVFPFKGESF